MRIFAQMARVIGLVVCCLAVIFYSGALLMALVAFAASGPTGAPELMAGRLLGALFADLLFLAVAIRFWKGITRNR